MKTARVNRKYYVVKRAIEQKYNASDPFRFIPIVEHNKCSHISFFRRLITLAHNCVHEFQ